MKSNESQRPLLRCDLDHVLERTESMWRELRNRHIFITGGTGFYGAWLLESLLAADVAFDLNVRAVVLTRDPSKVQKQRPHLFARPTLKFIKGDIRDFDFPDGTFSHVIHAATDASATMNKEEPLRMLDTIVHGTRRTLDFAAAHGCEKFLLASSGAVYGRQPSDLSMISEEYLGAPDPLNPGSAYGEGKRLAELLASQYAKSKKFEVKIARGFAFMGPHISLDGTFAAGNFIRDALAGLPIQIAGDGTPLRSYLYGADLAVWLWTLLFRGSPSRAYNVGSDQMVSIRDLAQTIAKQAGVDVQVAQTAVPGAVPERYVPSVIRARSELGLKVEISLEEGIRRTFSWYRNETT
jgi:nucleoside-diphosphate-sugar epimerase